MSGLEELIERLEKAEGPSRELDYLIGEFASEQYVQSNGWKLVKLGADYDGGNACEFYTPNGKLLEGFGYPNRGAVHRFYHVPREVRFAEYTSSLDAAVALAERVLDRLDLLEITFQIGGSKQHCTAETEHGEFDGINMPTLPLAIVIATLKARAVQENRA